MLCKMPWSTRLRARLQVQGSFGFETWTGHSESFLGKTRLFSQYLYLPRDMIGIKSNLSGRLNRC